MDNLLITLPCGFRTKYNANFRRKDKFKCPVCKNHLTSAEECFKMTRNKLAINQHLLDLKSIDLSDNFKHLEMINKDPSFYIDESFSELKNQIDVRREEIKLFIINQIDDYYEDLLLKIDQQKKLKLKEFSEKVEKIFSNKILMEKFEISNDLDINFQLDLVDQKKDIMVKLIKSTNEVIDDFTAKNLHLNQSKKNLNIADLFGNLGPSNKPNIFLKNDTINIETTLRLPIRNFSQFKNGKTPEASTKPVKVQNVEWSIHATSFKEYDGQMAFVYSLKSQYLNNLSMNLNAELRLLHLTNSNRNLTSKIDCQPKPNKNGNNYFKYISMKDIIDSEKGYYNTLDDTITIEAWIKQGYKKILKKKEFSDSYDDTDSNRSDSDSHHDNVLDSHYDNVLDSDGDSHSDSNSHSDGHVDLDLFNLNPVSETEEILE